MLMARDQEGNLVSALDGMVKAQEEYHCPACHGPVLLRQGKVVCPHFAHKSLEECRFFTENESAQHLGLKAMLYESLTSNGAVVEVERILPDIGQVADVFVGDCLALEVQCSRLSQERLRERTKAYQKAGYQVRWLLGRDLWLKKRLTSLQRDFLYFTAQAGFHLWELDQEHQEIRLKYLIYEDIFGRCYHLTKTWPLSANLMEVLRFPYRDSNQVSYRVQQGRQIARRIQRELMGKNQRWLKRQERAYQKGMNLLVLPDERFYPQVRFPKSESGFCQIQTSLTGFARLFNRYYRKAGFSRYQTLYPPIFYAKIVRNRL